MDRDTALAGSAQGVSPDNMLGEAPDEALTALRDYLEKAKKMMTDYSCAIIEVETKFNVLNRQFSLDHDRNPIENIKTRLKSPESIIGKLQRRNLPFTVEAVEEYIQDVAGIRVICPFIEDIYMLSECLLEQDDVRLIQKKDYIKNPKPNGYRSLHLIIETPIFLKNEKKLMKVEVQLRTIAMDFWASLEHRLRYKKELPAEVSEALAGELKICAEASAMLDQRMENVKRELESYSVEE